MKLTSHPEYGAAAAALLNDLDIPEQIVHPTTALIGCSLCRVFFRFWHDQDRKDPEWMPTPGGDVDPEWHRIDGYPESGQQGLMDRKWAQRARLYMNWYAIDVWHVLDWLTVADTQDHTWLYRLDDEGYPSKLTKCADLERLVVEATKGLSNRNRKPGTEFVLAAAEEERIADLGVGYSLVQLHTPTALRREGVRMHNCLRNGDYGRRLIDLKFSYLSVRDPDDRPHGTLEVFDGRVQQFAGPCNLAPTAAVFDLVAGVVDHMGWVGLTSAIAEFPDAENEDPDPPVENGRRV